MDIQYRLNYFRKHEVPANVWLHFAVFEGHTKRPKLAKMVLRFCSWLMKKAGLEVIAPMEDK
jgi:hypothetical protein